VAEAAQRALAETNRPALPEPYISRSPTRFSASEMRYGRIVLAVMLSATLAGLGVRR